MVELPGHYMWSSFCHNSGEREISFIKPHATYQALRANTQEIVNAYISLFSYHIELEDNDRIRESWITGTPLGSDAFRERVELQLQCKVGFARRGRPVKVKVEKGF